MLTWTYKLGMLELNAPTSLGIFLGLLLVVVFAYLRQGKPTIADVLDTWRNTPENKERIDNYAATKFGIKLK